MTSAEDEEILNELNNVTMTMQQLVGRKKVLSMVRELKTRICSEQPAKTQANEQEFKNIDKELEMLEARRAELQQQQDKLRNGGFTKPDKKVGFSADSVDSGFFSSSPQFLFIEPPPTYPAPTVILNPEDLQLVPCRTQCPECREFITTTTASRVSGLTFLACAMITMMGCVAGCCLAPFCMDQFKSITHRCPKCNTAISTVSKL